MYNLADNNKCWNIRFSALQQVAEMSKNTRHVILETYEEGNLKRICFTRTEKRYYNNNKIQDDELITLMIDRIKSKYNWVLETSYQ